jgi:alkylhydroperoxidase family enzyme
VGESDFNRLRELGVSDAEIIEIVLIAAIMTLNNILSDVLKIPVDDAVEEALGR